MNERNKLIKWAESKIGTPFVWGESDCSTLTMEGIKEYYGVSFPVENTWKSLKDAMRGYVKYGSPPSVLAKEGFKIIPKNFEQTGDIFVWKGNGYWLIGMVINSCVLIADEGKRIELRPILSFGESYLVFGRR